MSEILKPLQFTFDETVLLVENAFEAEKNIDNALKVAANIAGFDKTPPYSRAEYSHEARDQARDRVENLKKQIEMSEENTQKMELAMNEAVESKGSKVLINKTRSLIRQERLNRIRLQKICKKKQDLMDLWQSQSSFVTSNEQLYKSRERLNEIIISAGRALRNLTHAVSSLVENNDPMLRQIYERVEALEEKYDIMIVNVRLPNVKFITFR